MQIAFIIIVVCTFFLKKKKLSLEKECSNGIKGMLALLIVLQHSLIEYKDSAYLSWFHDIGTWICGMFFFISAYGLYSQEVNIKEMSLSKFTQKRILNIFLPFALITLGYQVLIAIIDDFSLSTLANSLKTGCTDYLLPYSWFVFALLYLYLLTYFAIQKNRGTIFLFLAIMIYVIILRNVFHWGPWWYTSIYGYWLGMVVRKNKIKMSSLKNWRMSSIISLALILLFMYGHPKSLLNIVTPLLCVNNSLWNM